METNNNQNQNQNQKLAQLQNAVNKGTCAPIFNSMGVLPSGTMFDITSQMIETTIIEWLKYKGMDVNGLQVICATKRKASRFNDMAYAVQNTNLPFVLALFKQMRKEDWKGYSKKSGTATNALRKFLNNVSFNNEIDKQQLLFGDPDSEENKTIATLTNGRNRWKLPRKGDNRAIICADSDRVLGICFGIPENQMEKYLFTIVDIQDIPNSKGGGFSCKILINFKKAKKRPVNDPYNMLR